MKVNDPEVEYSMVSTPFQWLKMKLRRIWSNMCSIRFLMATATTLLSITGLSLLTSGIVLLVIISKYYMFLGDSFFVLPIFMIAVAVIIFCTSILGYYSVKLKKYDFVVAYVAILVTILVLEIIITTLGFELADFSYSGRIINYQMFELMRWYNTPGDAYGYGFGYDYGYETVLWDSIQREGIITALAAWVAYKVKHQEETPRKGLLDSPMDGASKRAAGRDYSQYRTIPGGNICESDTNNIVP